MKKTIRVVAAIIKDDDKFFCTQRGYGEFKGYWEFPGGKIEEGETSEDALKREIKEELDITIKVEDLIETVEYDYPQFHLSMDCFYAEIVSGKIELKEHKSAIWLEKNKLETLDWLPADEALIRKIKKEK